MISTRRVEQGICGLIGALNLAAVESRATVGEISDELRRAFGESQESVWV